MGFYLGLDVGSTTLSVVVLDAATGKALLRHTADMACQATSPHDRRRGRSELDLDRLMSLVLGSLAQAAEALGDRAREIHGMGITGQQHGLALLGTDGRPVAPAITWQDRRAEETIPGTEESYLSRFISLSGGQDAFSRTGCIPASGFMGLSLFWLQSHDLLPSAPVVACMIPDAVVARLTGQPPVTDPTGAASSGIMDIISMQWDWTIIDRLQLPRATLGPIAPTGQLAGRLLPELAGRTGLPLETPVFVSMGDNQTSFLGSVREPAHSLLVNVGTGSQVSVLMDAYHRRPGLDTRPFVGGQYLLVGAGLFGGRSYAYLQDLFREVGAAFYGACGQEKLYDSMTAAASAVPSGSVGLSCAPLFTGTRVDPTVSASFTGITPANLTPGHMTRALLEGMAEQLYGLCGDMAPYARGCQQLIGAGNAIRRNPLFAEILACAFGLPLRVPAHNESAAIGACLLAGVGSGELATWEAASALVSYLPAVPSRA